MLDSISTLQLCYWVIIRKWVSVKTVWICNELNTGVWRRSTGHTAGDWAAGSLELEPVKHSAQRSSEPTWGAPLPSCAASCPSAPPAAHAPPRCPLVPTGPIYGPSLTRRRLSLNPSGQLVSLFLPSKEETNADLLRKTEQELRVTLLSWTRGVLYCVEDIRLIKCYINKLEVEISPA